jgi:hypothetical protein
MAPVQTAVLRRHRERLEDVTPRGVTAEWTSSPWLAVSIKQSKSFVWNSAVYLCPHFGQVALATKVLKSPMAGPNSGRH